MRVLLLSSLSLFFFFGALLQRELCEALSETHNEEQANLPPRGWNSYDSYSWTITEEQFLQNAAVVSQKLLTSGYEYVVVDFLWYRKFADGGFSDAIDEWGRVIPNVDKWPSSNGGKGFTEVANQLHGMGLKFGIHVMRGISTQAVDANTLILDTVKGGPYEESGRQWRTGDIGLKERTCAWMPSFMTVDTNLGAGRAFLRSLYLQYAEWGVDFVKNDCVFGDDMEENEIRYISELLQELDRPIIYSLSPGTSVTPAMADIVSNLVNMYRITGDDWDRWEDVAAHFDVTRDMAAANKIGGQGLKGKSWPDLDMLPFGWLSDAGSDQGPHRQSNLNLDEQRSQMTLCCMAKSPLMFGGDLLKLDDPTLNIITEPDLLEINAFSTKNMQFQSKGIPFITARKELRNDNMTLTRKSRSLKEERTLDTHVMGLTSCKDSEAKGWVIEARDQEMERICWKYNLGSKNMPPFCLHKRKPQFTSNEEMVYGQRLKGKMHLLAADKDDLCLKASPSRKLTSREIQSSSFSPCKLDANQMWELRNGTLVSSYSGLCATVKTVKASDDTGDVRAWVATGTKGELYLAFFNLSQDKMNVSAHLQYLAMAFPTYSINSRTCTYREVWSKQVLGEVKEHTITAIVNGHACALFVITCN